MKLTFEVNGYVINIDETEDGMVSVSATKDDEIVEEFTLEGGEDFDDEGGEDDFEGSQELPEEPIEGGHEGQPQAQAQVPQAQLGESKLESFAAFLKRK